jgi:hypothetical protein
MITPEIVQCCIELRMLINYNADPGPDTSGCPGPKVGMTPKGQPMPQTPAEWKYLGDLYEHGMLEAQTENSRLRVKINDQAQRLSNQAITISDMMEQLNE